MIDNLKEAIAHAREVASKQRRRFEDIYCQEEQTEAERKEAIACLDCSNEHGQLVAWLEELAERREADRWIPVSERLPEIATPCLVQLSNGYITMGKYHSIRGGSWVFIDTTIQFAYPKDSVIAWKPLPKPYESEDK